MKFLLVMLLIMTCCLPVSFGQDLFGERIRKISPRKKAIFLEKGIFHNGGVKQSSTLKAIRHFYSAKRGYERVVFDFTTAKPPKIYGYISPEEKKIYIDLFETNMHENMSSFGNSQHVQNVAFFPIERGNVSLEMMLKKKSSVDVFYLENPGRFIIDIKQ